MCRWREQISWSRCANSTEVDDVCNGCMYFFSSHYNEANITLAAWDQSVLCTIPDSKVHGANMGSIWGRQDPGGPHVGPMSFAIRDTICSNRCRCIVLSKYKNLQLSLVMYRQFSLAFIHALLLLMVNLFLLIRSFEIYFEKTENAPVNIRDSLH